MSLTSALRTRRGFRCSRCQRVYCICPRRPASPLDTALGTITVAGLTAAVDGVARSEPDLSARYRVPAAPAAPVDRIRSAWALTQAIDGLDLDRSAHKLLVWADSWSAENVAGLVALIEAARAAGGAR